MHTRWILSTILNGSVNTLVCLGIGRNIKRKRRINVDIEKELNELIKRCTEKGGHVWIVDKKGNNFSIRLTEEVKIRPYEPKAKEESNNGLD
jgi:hypothetical protein